MRPICTLHKVEMVETDCEWSIEPLPIDASEYTQYDCPWPECKASIKRKDDMTASRDTRYSEPVDYTIQKG